MRGHGFMKPYKYHLTNRITYICSNSSHIIVSVTDDDCIVYAVKDLYPLITSC